MLKRFLIVVAVSLFCSLAFAEDFSDVQQVDLGRIPASLAHKFSNPRVTAAGNPLVFVLTTGFSPIVRPQYADFGTWTTISSFWQGVYFYVVLVNLESKTTSVSFWWDIESQTGGKQFHIHSVKNFKPLSLTGFYTKKTLRSSVDLYKITATVGKPLPANPIDFAQTKFIAGN